MSRSDVDYLRHILDEARYLTQQSAGIDLAAFVQDETLKRAFVRSIEVIGEAAKQLSEDIRQRYPEIEWRAMAGCVIGSSMATSGSITRSSGMWSPARSQH
jgi:uncharacterized protein with HEPN domain